MARANEQGTPSGTAGSVSLIDEDGAGIFGALADGTAVEILRWVPRGAKTLYHVRSGRDGSLSWIGARDLRAGMAATPRSGAEPAKTPRPRARRTAPKA